jgi:hypothetical protein
MDERSDAGLNCGVAHTYFGNTRAAVALGRKFCL